MNPPRESIGGGSLTIPRDTASSRPPDFLVVILDSARSADFPGGTSPLTPMPFAEGLLRESLSFPRAVAPAPWTIPSHASLFTGLYPWEHGTHLRRSLRLDPSIPTLAQLLGEHGYATFAASSNGFLSPEFGLLHGFSAAAWGEWWERFLHLPGSQFPPRGFNCGPTMKLPESRYWKMLETPGRYANRRPAMLDVLNRVASGLRDPGAETYSPFIASWIEPVVERWLKAQPAERPVFCFVNYYEAHEPYIISPSQVEGGMTWRDLLRLRMDRTNMLAGRWSPTPREFADLRRLYRAVVRALDARLARLADVFRAAGRWDNTVVVLSSDHGQAFGEHGYLFHGSQLWEPVVRVPLWLRLPDGRHRGEQATGWA
ncbi:MAG: sulfatase-like hydrolase/transferase, partial [Thermoplasmata archaeon]